MTPIDIAVDFDGTVVAHDYPRIGHDIGAFPVLRRLVEHGHRLILFTMRSGDQLEAAVQLFADHGVPLYGVGKHPTQDRWTSSPKCYAQIYLDDAALGAPLTYGTAVGRPFYDWPKTEKILEAMGVLPKTE